jgi:hypothetical protein
MLTHVCVASLAAVVPELMRLVICTKACSVMVSVTHLASSAAHACNIDSSATHADEPIGNTFWVQYGNGLQHGRQVPWLKTMAVMVLQVVCKRSSQVTSCACYVRKTLKQKPCSSRSLVAPCSSGSLSQGYMQLTVLTPALLS